VVDYDGCPNRRQNFLESDLNHGGETWVISEKFTVSFWKRELLADRCGASPDVATACKRPLPLPDESESIVQPREHFGSAARATTLG
jgi:hypothetical protein